MTPGRAANGELYFFLHLQKTGGTAMVHRLQRCFGESAVYPSELDGDAVERVINANHLLDTLRRRGDEIRIITGHFPLAVVELLDQPVRTFTLLREPVERTLSFLRHQQVMGDTRTDLEEIYDDPFLFRGLIHNHMVKMLTLDAGAVRASGALADVEMSDSHLGQAIDRLETIEVVGLQEDYERFVVNLEHAFGWDLGSPLWANRTPPQEASDELRERIARDNRLDVELYGHAIRLIEAREATEVS